MTKNRFDTLSRDNNIKCLPLWINETTKSDNSFVNATSEPISYTPNAEEDIMEVSDSGDFDGSPIVLKYHLRINKGKIEYLKITG